MHEPPANLPDARLRAALRDAYGLDVAELAFLPIGYDAAAWVYRARAAGGATYFLKVRLAVNNEAALVVPRYLHDHGVARVVAPLPTASGALWANLDGFALILYPFVAGASGHERGLTDRQWVDYGALLRRVHDTPVSPELAVRLRRETFAPDGAAMVRRLDAYLDGRVLDDPLTSALAGFWAEHRAEIRTVLARAEVLGRRLARAEPPLVLCHADIHTANVLVDDDGQVWFVDWDETMLAPRERDLMFALGGGISTAWVRPRDEARFLAGYQGTPGVGAIAIDPLGLAYYRYAWAVSDIGAFGEEVCFRPDLGDVSRQVDLRGFRSLFEPGAIVALALGADVEGA
ncbi:MAG TPA: phosphotransferase [Thermomicrobiaceae bacterium]|nr:phosphotransferase [Thermomicrobiaceae bacterium]